MSEGLSVPAAASSPLGGAGRALRWVCTSNPFYVLSAGLFLVGLWISFGEQWQLQAVEPEESWALMGWLAGYTLLLAGTAFLLVRFAKVWDDARTVLLLVVLMFLATSVTFDEVLVQAPRHGIACNLISLALAIVISEGLLRGIKLRLPPMFRVPYFLILSLFFLYPLALVPLIHELHNELHMWLLFAFSGAAGMAFLTLLPAARRGPDYVANNGSPWPWPLYPWSLFAILALAVVGRAFLLCYSMHLPEGAFRGGLIFGPYFLVPFGMAIAVLLLELGLQARSQATLITALSFPIAMIALAGTGHRDERLYQEFLAIFTDRLGASPVYFACGAATLFYGYAGLRGVPWAAGALAVALAGLAIVNPPWLSEPWPILLAGVLALVGWRWRHKPSLKVAGLLAGCWLAAVGWHGYRALRASLLGLDYIVLSLAAFSMAVVVSLRKAGLLWRSMRRTE